MFPNNQLSQPPVIGKLLFPDSLRTGKLVDFEEGGVGIGNTAQGNLGYTWRAYAQSGDIYIQRGTDAPTLYTTAPGVQELAFAFDQNMRPVFAFQHATNRIDLLWYDPILQAYTLTTGMATGKNPRLSLDDKRPAQVSASDVILGYIRSGTLYYRIQRERYATERTATTGLPPYAELRNVGMANNNRFHFIVR